MNNFKKFCCKMTRSDIPNIPDDIVANISLTEETRINNIGKDIKAKIEFIDKVPIPYIEKKFEDLEIDDVASILENKNLQDIPDDVLEKFSQIVFGCSFNQLESGWKRSIISVLTVYILI